MDTHSLGFLGRTAGWATVCWIVIFWRLGYLSLLDPDEAHYAQITREMLAARQWLVPLLDAAPFIDKPVLFHWLQGLSFALLGPTELAARLPSAAAGLALLAATYWLGRCVFNAEIGARGALMLATTPAMFALSSIGIFDMIFTTFLFGGVAFCTVAAMRERWPLQYPGYVLIALAILTKGPVALVLVGLSFALALLLGRDLRRHLLRLHWVAGSVGIVVAVLPWFVYMWYRFGTAFVDGYLLYGNLWLFSRPLYRARPYYLFYGRVTLLALLPWSLVSIGRLVDLLRRRAGTVKSAEKLLWLWSITVIGFFTFSRFKLDTYIFPAAPALCLLAAHAWQEVRGSERHATNGCTRLGIVLIPVVLIAFGVVSALFMFRIGLQVDRGAVVMPVASIAGGLVFAWQLGAARLIPPRLPKTVVVSLLIVYGTVVLIGFPVYQKTRPVPEMATWLARTVTADDQVAVFRLGRWKASLRFYLNRPVLEVTDLETLRALFARPERVYCVLLDRDYEHLRQKGTHIRIVHEREAVVATSGRGFRRQVWGRVIVATNW